MYIDCDQDVTNLEVDEYTERGTCKYYITARSKYACGIVVLPPTPTPAPAQSVASTIASPVVAGATLGGLIGGAALAIGSLWFAAKCLRMPLSFLQETSEPLFVASTTSSSGYGSIPQSSENPSNPFRKY